MNDIRNWKDALAMCACYAITYGPMLALLVWVVVAGGEK